MLPNTPPNERRTDHRSSVTVAEAARALGLTTDAVRMRLKRGALAGEKQGAEWIVWLPGAEQTTEHHRTTADQTSEQTTEQAGPSWADLVAVKDAALGAQADEITFLRGQLDQRSRELADERERSDVLHREAFARIEALTAGLTTMVADDDDELRADSVHKSDGSPQTAEDAPGATDAASPSDESNARPSTAPRTVFGDILAWLRGR